MGNMYVLIILVVVCDQLSTVNTQCTGGAQRCDWITWEPWNDCSATCGGGQRLRTRPLCCDTSLTFDQCQTTCGLLDEPSYEWQDCNEICYNGGAMGTYSCTCVGGYYGPCCQNLITCATPTTISNGGYTGTNFDYGGTITYHCDSGYGQSEGDLVHNCSRTFWATTGYWDGVVPTCVDIETCNSSPCQNGATCINGLGEYTCVCGEGYSGDNCQFDIQPPLYRNCSSNLTFYSSEPSAVISWTEPIFYDPLGNDLVISKNYQESEALLPWGEYVVQYVADKLSNGLRAECLFSVKVLPFPCPSLEVPSHGAFACNGWNYEYTAVCLLFCEEDKNAPGAAIENYYVCGGSGQWSTIPNAACTENRLTTTPNERYYSSNCASDNSTQRAIQETYLTILNNSSWVELCTNQLWDGKCVADEVTLIC